ncbi:hypothetical protein VTN49DRAFT_7562 [Thermomyces lanuginosus]|uniref:uncharacterized protein n=1 Tax=Thermomyces lanuginosus TaxID=5541 RepID=UPI00374442A5
MPGFISTRIFCLYGENKLVEGKVSYRARDCLQHAPLTRHTLISFRDSVLFANLSPLCSPCFSFACTRFEPASKICTLVLLVSAFLVFLSPML